MLVGFVFSEESGRKFRPAVIISSGPYNRARQEVIVERSEHLVATLSDGGSGRKEFEPL